MSECSPRLNDDERAALQAALSAGYGDDALIDECDKAIWRAAGRYYLEMAAKICEDGTWAKYAWGDEPPTICCAKAIRKRIEGTTA